MSAIQHQPGDPGFWNKPYLTKKLGSAVRVLTYLVVTAAMLLLFYKFEDLGYQNYVRDLKLEATVDLVEERDKIERDIYKHVLNLAQLAAIIGQNPDINQTEFNIKALDYLLENSAVQSISVAPDLVVGMVFPRFGNQDLIGLDFKNDPEQIQKITEIMRTGEGMITGRVDAKPDEQGITLRKPIDATNRDGSSRPWGMISVALNYDAFIEQIGIPEFEQKYDLVIRETQPSVEGVSDVLYGSETILDHDPIALGLSFTFGKWEMAVTPQGGWPLHRPNYEIRWLQCFALIALCLLGLWWFLRTVDARRSAEEKLFIGIEALDHGFVMFDGDRRLTAFNKKYKELAGGSGMVRIGSRYEDIVKANLENGLIPDAVGREEEWYEKWSQRLDIKSSDNEQVLADGRMIRAYDRPMDDGSVVGLRIDITDLKKAQIAAEAANKAKTEFLGVLSHELRTPLTVVLGNAKLTASISNMPIYKDLVSEIEQSCENSDDVLPKLELVNQQICKMMASLEKSGSHLFDLISEVLDFAKVDSGTASLNLEHTKASSIIDPVVEQLHDVVHGKGLELISNVEDCTVTADVKRIQQILINLISNASKFTAEGSITLNAKQDDQNLIVSVTDTGIGIPEDHLECVFEAFQQVDYTDGRSYGGTGLGLAISRDLAHAHGGDLSLESTIGKGSTFTLVIPRQQADAVPEEPEEHVEETDRLVA